MPLLPITYTLYLDTDLQVLEISTTFLKNKSISTNPTVPGTTKTRSYSARRHRSEHTNPVFGSTLIGATKIELLLCQIFSGAKFEVPVLPSGTKFTFSTSSTSST